MQANGRLSRTLIFTLVLLILAAGCQSATEISTIVQTPTINAILPSQTPFQPQEPTLVPVTMTPALKPAVSIGFHPGVPENLVQQISLPDGIVYEGTDNQADLTLIPYSEFTEIGTTWVFALVAPFPTVQDEISKEELTGVWSGEMINGWENVHLYLTETTRTMLESLWGPGSESVLRIASDSENMIEQAWADQPSLAIVPFEELDPRWKVIKVDGLSPLSKNFPASQYFLSVNFKWVGENLPQDLPVLPVSNRMEEEMTVITMTGVTALVRATGFMMDKYGINYPGEDIRDWMIEPDFTHVSNEVSFDPSCPAQDPNQQGLLFCSRPAYIELLDHVGVDIVELTGNHLMDFKQESLPYTMDLYRERGWLTFGGGNNIEEASQPAILEHNGNRFAFVGCNPAGPGGDWAGPSNPGSQPCDWEAFRQQIHELKEQGYLVIATLQYSEIYVSNPLPQQVADFQSLSEAGAIIVQGSQAHFPQGFGFLNGHLIHYGLGNLFFDQMDYPVVGTRREFLDRHVFYKGKHISTELMTAMLENYARPRPMTSNERQAFLQDIFTASGW